MDKNEVLIVTGLVRSGKTTRLLDWASKQEIVKGIASPFSGNKRMFYDLSTHESFSMEAKEGEESMKIGKYNFSIDSFKRAVRIIAEGIENNSGFLVIDEIGPLELENKGFNKILRKILSTENREFSLVLVIRDTMVDDVLKQFGIKNYSLLNL
jgi:nucleoside-triphosphatase